MADSKGYGYGLEDCPVVKCSGSNGVGEGRDGDEGHIRAAEVGFRGWVVGVEYSGMWEGRAAEWFGIAGAGGRNDPQLQVFAASATFAHLGEVFLEDRLLAVGVDGSM